VVDGVAIFGVGFFPEGRESWQFSNHNRFFGGLIHAFGGLIHAFGTIAYE